VDRMPTSARDAFVPIATSRPRGLLHTLRSHANRDRQGAIYKTRRRSLSGTRVMSVTFSFKCITESR